jgi:hypothetical protein
VRALLLAGLLVTGSAAAEERLERTTEVGPVRATVRVEPAAPLIGDALVLEIDVRAEPGVELLMPEFGEALDLFVIVDFVPSETVDDEGATVARQRYTLQASRSGDQSIPPILVEFVDRRAGQAPAPEGEDAYELLTERLDFEVGSALPADAPLELRPPRPKLHPLAAPGPSLWPFLVGAVLLLGAAAPFATRAWIAYRARVQRRSASEIAYAELEALMFGGLPDRERLDAFYVELSGIVRRYVENRFGLRSPELTTEEFLEVMSTAPDLSGDHRGLLRGFLVQADLVKFAHYMPDSSAVEDSVGSAKQFLEETRENLLSVRGQAAEAAGV